MPRQPSTFAAASSGCCRTKAVRSLFPGPLLGPAVSPAGAFARWLDFSARQAGPARARARRTDSGRRKVGTGSHGSAGRLGRQPECAEQAPPGVGLGHRAHDPARAGTARSRISVTCRCQTPPNSSAPRRPIGQAASQEIHALRSPECWGVRFQNHLLISRLKVRFLHGSPFGARGPGPLAPSNLPACLLVAPELRPDAGSDDPHRDDVTYEIAYAATPVATTA